MTHVSLPTVGSPARAVLWPGELRVEPQWLEGGTCVVTVAGEVDLQTSPLLAETLAPTSRNGTTAVVVDLTECTFIDSTGLRVLVDANEALRGSGRTIWLVASDRVLRALELSGLDAVFRVFRSRAAAPSPAKETWRQEAHRRVSIRDANERLERSSVGLASPAAEGRVSFFCECGDPACTSRLQLELAEYEAVRRHPARFVIARDHENPEAERVVQENGRFAVVETVTGELSKQALESNPRWQRGEPW